MNSISREKFSPKAVLSHLVRGGYLSQDQARHVFSMRESVERKLARKAGGKPVGIIEVLWHLAMDRADRPGEPLDEDAIYQGLAGAWRLDYMKINPLKLNMETVTKTIPKNFAMKHLVLPVVIKDGELTVAMSDPFDTEVLDDLKRVSQMRIRPVVTARSDIERYINEFFGFRSSIAAAKSQYDGSGIDLGNLEQFVKLGSYGEIQSSDHHIINAVNHLFSYAFDQRASDIHIEPKREVTVIRMRIDGSLHTVYELPRTIHSALVTRIKAMSRLDMAEKRRPQDGRIKTDQDGTEVEIRVSTVPVAFGEKVVMRVLHPDIMFQDLEKLGFTGEDLERYESLVNRPHGIVLVCGPTGSGKSTTLYSTLRRLASPEVNITTVEDPIEMIHEEFNQIAVQPQVGIKFGTILRNILRQDPDIIMLGEMRDLDTAENAAQAAMTGHLVLSTLHTNDAPSAITRLLDIGIPSYIIQATLAGVVAQRLVRRICPHCVAPYEMDSTKLKGLGLDVGKEGALTLYRGTGCVKCRGTGYLGRLAIFEILSFSDEIRRLTTRDTDAAAIRRQGTKEGMISLRESGIRQLLAGHTTWEELLRVTWESH
ncbi:GspE/PulE family protein [Desulfoluna sp.]|uniref:GspE/PulE family protein n=1 Tax=Desulfoluna sp. TaxID=2045199 RepID=UPI00262EB448|nr:GspE/PulE family protein [Desulfoluna sp.]